MFSIEFLMLVAMVSVWVIGITSILIHSVVKSVLSLDCEGAPKVFTTNLVYSVLIGKVAGMCKVTGVAALDALLAYSLMGVLLAVCANALQTNVGLLLVMVGVGILVVSIKLLSKSLWEVRDKTKDHKDRITKLEEK